MITDQYEDPIAEAIHRADNVAYGTGVVEQLLAARPTQPIIATVPGDKLPLRTPAAVLFRLGGDVRWVVEMIVDSVGIIVIAHGADHHRPLWSEAYPYPTSSIEGIAFAAHVNMAVNFARLKIAAASVA